MALTVKENRGGDFAPAPEGNHVAICYGVVDLGTQQSTFAGETKSAPKVRLMFELCDEKMENGKPFSLSTTYTASLGDRSNLRKMLETWRGRKFTPDELGGFQLANVVGKPCQVTVVHKPSADGSKIYANIASVTGLPKGMKAPSQINPSVIFDLEDFNIEVYQSLPQYLKDTIAKAPEFAQTKNAKQPVAAAVAEDDADNIF